MIAHTHVLFSSLLFFLPLTHTLFSGAQIKPLAKQDSNRFKTFFAPRTPSSSRRKGPYEVSV